MRVARICAHNLTFFIDVQIQKRLRQSETKNDMAPGATAPSYRRQQAPMIGTELQVNEALIMGGLSSARAIQSENLQSEGHKL